MRLPRSLRPLAALLERHRAHLPAAALITGAVWDFLTLGRPDSLFANASVISYLVIAGGCILILNARREREKESLLLVILLQFCLGNLASGLFVLYSQSATLVGSWLFLLMLLLFVLANEFARSRYDRLRFQLIAYHVLLTAYLGLVVPILFGEIGIFTFLLSCGVALGVMALYLGLINAFAPRRVREDWKGAISGILIVSLAFVGLYKLNLIPPVPLSLKEIEVYHHMTRAPKEMAPAIYEARGEGDSHWYDRLFKTPTLHLRAGEPAYCYSAVFAPDNLAAPIYHRYSRFDEETETWIDGDTIAFPIRGGRAEGYRGYTVGSVTPGKWRCSVETEGGALIGRIGFNVEEPAGTSTPELVTEYR